MIEYRGFTIEVSKNQFTGWTVKWEELTGSTRRRSNNRDDRAEAISYAKQRIDEYHNGIETAQYPKVAR